MVKCICGTLSNVADSFESPSKRKKNIFAFFIITKHMFKLIRSQSFISPKLKKINTCGIPSFISGFD